MEMWEVVIVCTFLIYAHVFVTFIDALLDRYSFTIHSMPYVISIIGVVLVTFF